MLWNGGFVDENIIDMIPVPSKGLNPRAEYFAQYAKGESMKDAGINDGDLLILKEQIKLMMELLDVFAMKIMLLHAKNIKSLME